VFDLFLLPEEWFPWRLRAADLLVGILIAVATYLVASRLAARRPAHVLVGRRIVRLVSALLLAGLVVLAGRRVYGPPIRLALTAPVDRPAQRFADRFARSPEIQAWYARRTAELRASGESEDMLPRTLSYERSELLRNGFLRLSDEQLKLRTDLLAGTFSRFDGSGTRNSRFVGFEGAIPCLLPDFNRVVGEAWFQLVFAAMVAEAQGTSPSRLVSDEERHQFLAEVAPSQAGLVRGPDFHTPTESGIGEMRRRCARERGLYKQVSGWDGPRRARADRVLATADSFLTDQFDKHDDENTPRH
jgi:hypothetical protein